MGNEAEATEEINEEVTEEAPAEQPEAEQPEGEDAEQTEEAPELEIVRSGEHGSQPDKQHGIRKRINKLNEKVAKATEQTSDAEQRLELSEQKNKILSLALEQSRGAQTQATPPDPADFDNGARDPKYIAAFNEYNQPLIAAEVQKQTANLSAPEPINRDLERMQTQHYERAEGLKAKDFDETEDAAIAILGKDFANELIQSSEKSEMIMYYLGKNPREAEGLKDLIEQNTKASLMKCLFQIGRLEAELEMKPKTRTEPTPDPDDELKGGSPSAGKTNMHQRAVEKARESGDIKAVMNAKRAARTAGVTVT